MAHETATTASVADFDDFHNGMQQLAQHNIATRYGRDQQTFDSNGYPLSGSNSVYSTPEPGHLIVDQYGRTYNGPYVDHYQEALEAQTDGYGTPMYYPNPADGYYASPAAQSTPYAAYHVSSPATPAASDRSSPSKRKRETRSLARTGSPSPRPKRNKQAKAEKTKVPKIDAPLSVLTKDYDHIPVKDMDAWVNRSAEVRQKEVEKRKGKITRPMNSFMLYRSAYADRTKVWCLQNNHQVVSSVSGESWPIEPKEVRDLYTEYARVERDNHQKAHPGYKFSPSKAGTASRKRRDTSEEEEELSDLDDLDSEWRPSRSKASRANTAKRSTPGPNWQMDSTAYSSPDTAMTSNPVHGYSAYQHANPGKPLPVPMMNEHLYGQYYQTTVRPNISHPYTEDVFIHRTDHAHAGISYGTGTPLIGLPGGSHYELLDEHAPEHTSAPPPAPLVEPQVDPYLLAQGDEDFRGPPLASGNHHELQAFDHPDYFATDTEDLTYHDDPTLARGTEDWQFGGETSPGATIAEFDKWFGQTNEGEK